MLKRTITGAVIFLITVGFLFLKQVSNLFFDAYVLIFMYGAIFEMKKAYKKSGAKIDIIPLFFVPAVFCVIFNLEKNYFMQFVYVFVVAIVLLVIFLTEDIIIFAKDRKKGTTEKNVEVLNKTLFEKTKNSMSVFVYPLVVLSFLMALNHLPYTASYIGLILTFAVSMLTDTCAYFVGVLFGKKKFIPEVSPKKSVEGVFGGVAGGLVAAAAVFSIFFFTKFLDLKSSFELWKLILTFSLIGTIGSYINQLGDLVASAFKRRVGIKDFSNIFPGHGGFLDRVDGLMFVGLFNFLVIAILLV